MSFIEVKSDLLSGTFLLYPRSVKTSVQNPKLYEANHIQFPIQFQRYLILCRLNPNASPRYFQLSYFECLKSKYVQATVSTGSSHRQEKFISEAYYLILSNTSC